jgi:hypothetical protein
MQNGCVSTSRQAFTRPPNMYLARDLALRTTGPPALRPGWLGRLVRAAALPAGIPPGRSRPEPSGMPR